MATVIHTTSLLRAPVLRALSVLGHLAAGITIVCGGAVAVAFASAI